MDSSSQESDFLEQLRSQGSLHSEGSFSVDSVRARRLKSAFLGANPYDCVTWVANAAISGGATKVAVRWLRPGFRIYDNAPRLTRAEAEAIIDGRVDSPRLHKLSIALYLGAQAKPALVQYVTPEWSIRWSSSGLVLEPSKLERDVFGRNYFHWGNRRLLDSITGFQDTFKNSARFCPANLLVNGRRFKPQKVLIPRSSPAAELWRSEEVSLQAEFEVSSSSKEVQAVPTRQSPGPYSAVLWLNPKPTQTSHLTLLDHGLVVSVKRIGLGYPGFEAVIWAQHWNYDLSGQIRQDETFQEIVEHLKTSAKDLLVGLPEAEFLTPKGLDLDGSVDFSKVARLPLIPLLPDVQHVEISPDSRFLLVLSCDQVRLLRVDAPKLSMIAAFPRLPEFASSQNWFSFCPDNQIFAILTGAKEVAILRRRDGSCLETVELEESIISLSFSPLGCLLFLADQTGAVWSYEPDIGSLVQLVVPKKPWSGPMSEGRVALAISGDGSWLAMEQEDGLLLTHAGGEVVQKIAKQRLSCFDPASRFVLAVDDTTTRLHIHWLVGGTRSRNLCSFEVPAFFYFANRPLLIGNSVFVSRLQQRLDLETGQFEPVRRYVADAAICGQKIVFCTDMSYKVDTQSESGSTPLFDLGSWSGLRPDEVPEPINLSPGGFRCWTSHSAHSFAISGGTKLVLANLNGVLASLEQPRQSWLLQALSPERIAIHGCLGKKYQTFCWRFRGLCGPAFLQIPHEVEYFPEAEIHRISAEKKPRTVVHFGNGERWTGDWAAYWAPNRVLLQDGENGWTVRNATTSSLLHRLPSMEHYHGEAHQDYLVCRRNVGDEEEYWAADSKSVPRVPEFLEHARFAPATKRYVKRQHRQTCIYSQEGILVKDLGDISISTLDPLGRWLVVWKQGLSAFDLLTGDCLHTLEIAGLNPFQPPDFVWDKDGTALCVVQDTTVWPLELDRQTGHLAVRYPAFQFPAHETQILDNRGKCWNYRQRQSTYSLPQLSGESFTVLLPGCLEIYNLRGLLELRVYLLDDGYLAMSPDGGYDGFGDEFQSLVADTLKGSYRRPSDGIELRRTTDLFATVWKELQASRSQ